MSARERARPWFRSFRLEGEIWDAAIRQSVERAEVDELERRLHCRMAGHDVVEHDQQPVTTFFLCRRCGRFARTEEELERMR